MRYLVRLICHVCGMQEDELLEEAYWGAIHFPCSGCGSDMRIHSVITEPPEESEESTGYSTTERNDQ